MKRQVNGYVSVCSWSEVRDQVREVNAGLFQVIEQLDVDDRYELVRVRYPFGAEILRGGVLQLPNDAGEIVSVTDASLSPYFAKAFAYAFGMPMTLQLQNGVELFLQVADQVVPFRVNRPGDMLGLVSVLDPYCMNDKSRLWNISSGYRNLFMLPKISDAVSHRRLKRDYGIHTAQPRSLQMQWDVFTEIASRRKTPWESELLFFTQPWMEHEDDPDWIKFRYYLLQSAWRGNAFSRIRMIHDFIISYAQSSRGLRPDPMLLDVVKHVLSVGVSGTDIAFQVARDTIGGPIEFIQQAYTDSYHLREHAPIMMHPGYLGHNGNESVYYSLQLPILLNYSPKAKRLASKIDDLREIKYLIEMIMGQIDSQHIGFLSGEDQNIFDQVNLAYFHSDVDRFGEIQSSENLGEEDPTIQEALSRFPDLRFCASSPFLKGCIRIARKS